MHLLVAAHDFYPDPGSGGTGRYVYETTRRLADRGHRVSVVTRRRGDVPAREALDGVDVYRYDVEIADRALPDILPQLPDAVRTVRDHVASLGADPDVVSFQGPVTSLLVDRAVDGGAARSATFHSPWPTEYAIKTRGARGLAAVRRRANVSARRWLEGRVLARTDHRVTLSEYMRAALGRVYGRDAKVVPGGVDVDAFAPDGRTYPAIDGGADGDGNGNGVRDGNGPTFLTVRRLSPRMGHDLLLAAFARVARERPDARLYVAGDGPLRETLERRARSLGVADQTTFLGYVPDADLPAAYAAADVSALPTVALEGFGLATLEALAAGTPVVGTPVGGTPEVLAPFEADLDLPAPLLVDAADPDAMAERMLDWAGVPAAERDAAGDACRRLARERFPWERTVDGLENVYADLV